MASNDPLPLVHPFRARARDLIDERALETALNGRADRLVTLNTADFAVAAQFRLAVVQLRELLRQLREVPS